MIHAFDRAPAHYSSQEAFAWVAGVEAALAAVEAAKLPSPGGASRDNTRAADLRAIRDLLDPTPTARELYSTWEYSAKLRRNRGDGAEFYPENSTAEKLIAFVDKHDLAGTEYDPRPARAEMGW
jgi:hypothetical protein